MARPSIKIWDGTSENAVTFSKLKKMFLNFQSNKNNLTLWATEVLRGCTLQDSVTEF